MLHFPLCWFQIIALLAFALGLPDLARSQVSAPEIPRREALAAARLIVPIRVNEALLEPVMVLVDADGQDVYLDPADLQEAGLLPDLVKAMHRYPMGGRSWVRLREAGSVLTFHMDMAQLVLEMHMQPQAMSAHRLDAGNPSRLQSWDYGASPLAFHVNYALTGAYSGSQAHSPGRSLEGVGSFRGHVLQSFWSQDSLGVSHRGPTSLLINDEKQLRQSVIGDAYYSGSGLLGGMNLGGILVQSQLHYVPGMVSTPTLGVRGMASTPSTIDVRVNGVLMSQKQIPAGPFELDNILAQTGPNRVEAVVRDAFGQETRYGTDNYYGSASLLKPGLSSYALGLGRLRQYTGMSEMVYGQSVGLAQWAYGVDNNRTIQAAWQATSGAQALAVQGVQTGDLGELSLQLAASRQAAVSPLPKALSGTAAFLAYRFYSTQWSVQASSLYRSKEFADVSTSLLQSQRVLSSQNLAGGTRLGPVDWGVRWSQTTLSDQGRTQRIGSSLARQWAKGVTTSVDLGIAQGAIHETSLFLMLIWTLDGGRMVSSTASHADPGRWGLTVDASQTPQEALSSSYRLARTWRADGQSSTLAQWGRDTAYGDYALQAYAQGHDTQTYWRASGALAWVDGVLEPTRPIRDGFALVRVPGVPGVPVTIEGRFAGETDAQGQLMVNGLAPYSWQRIAIDVDALPMQYQVGVVEHKRILPMKGAALVNFDVNVYRAYTGRVLDDKQRPMVNAVLLLSDGRQVSTGSAGDFVLEGQLPPNPAITVRRNASPTDVCRIHLPSIAVDPTQQLVKLGALTCVP